MSSGTRVYMGGISYRTREKDIERFFRKYGRIREISIKNGYAFIDFDDRRDADDAVYDLHGVDFMGERVSVEFAKGTPHGRDRERYGYGRSRSRSRSRGGGDRRPIWLDKYGPPTRTDYRVVVENLSSRVSWQDLKDFMRTAGEVTYADAHKQARNEGVVEFASYDDMKHAMDKLDDSELNGRRIRMVSQYKGGKRSRSRSRSRSRKRSRGGSRSGSRSRSRKSRSRSKKSRSRSRKSRSRSRSRSRKSKSGSIKGKSRSRSGRSKSRSRSRSDGAKSKSRGRSRSRSESGRRSRSKSMKSDKD